MSIRYADDKFEDLSSYSSVKEYKKRRKNRPGKIILKSFIALLCVLLIGFGSVLLYLSQGLFSGLSTVDITTDREALGISVNATVDTSIKNIAFFGVDSRDGSFTGLSDSIMVLSIDNKHNKIKMTSILRDTRIDNIDGIGAQKINAAYGYGGAELAIKTINQNFNLNIEDYVTINFYNMALVVDAFGGTEITMDDDEAYNTNKNLNALMYEQIHDDLERTVWESDFLPEIDGYVSGGTFTLNGNQAVAYARNRSDSDANRANRQKNVLVGLMKRLQKMNTLDYFPLLQKIFPMCETSMSISDIMDCAPIILKDIAFETLNIPGDEEYAYGGDLGDGLGWVFSYDLENAAHHIDRFIYEEASPYWDAAIGNGADSDDEPDWDSGVNYNSQSQYQSSSQSNNNYNDYNNYDDYDSGNDNYYDDSNDYSDDYSYDYDNGDSSDSGDYNYDDSDGYYSDEGDYNTNDGSYSGEEY